jgi:hypothetical protein
MKVFSRPILIFFLLISILTSNAEAQFKSFHASAYMGYGAIKGNSVAQESLCFSFSLGTGHEFVGDFELRVGYLYARKITYFLPEDRYNKYYPYIQSFSLKGFIGQELSHDFYLEGGVGLVLLNDRTFSDVNVWDTGMGANTTLGVDLRDTWQNGFKLGFGLDFAITFTNTTASYYIFNFQSTYYF